MQAVPQDALKEQMEQMNQQMGSMQVAVNNRWDIL